MYVITRSKIGFQNNYEKSMKFNLLVNYEKKKISVPNSWQQTQATGLQ